MCEWERVKDGARRRRTNTRHVAHVRECDARSIKGHAAWVDAEPPRWPRARDAVPLERAPRERVCERLRVRLRYIVASRHGAHAQQVSQREAQLEAR